MNRTLNKMVSALGGAMLVASLTAQAAAQQAVVRGRVLDAVTLQPVSAAQLQWGPGATEQALTGADGRFELNSTSTVQVTIQRIGYATQTLRIEPGSNPTIVLPPRPAELAAVHVRGFDLERTLLETPGSIALLTPEVLERYDNSSLVPALNAVPGVRVDQRQPGGSTRLSIRGSVLRSPFGIRNIRMYWNDIPLTLADGSTPADLLDVSAAGSVEVIKGPAGSIYGSGVGGALVIQTPRSTTNTVGQLSFSAGEYGYRRGSASVNLNGDRAQVRLSAVNQEHDGYRLAQDESSRKIYLVYGQLFPSERNVVSFYAYHARPTLGLPGTLNRAEYDSLPRLTLPFAEFFGAGAERERSYIGLANSLELNDWLTNTTSLYGMFTEWHGNSGSTSAASGAQTRENGSGYGGRTRFVVAPPMQGDVRLRFIVGGEYQADVVRNQSFGLDTNKRRTMLRSNSEVQSYQNLLFLQAEAELPAQIIVNAGLAYNNTRFDVLDYFTPAATNPTGELKLDGVTPLRIAAIKKFGDHLAVHAGISTGHSPPTVLELNPVGVPNTDLRAEDATQYEFGVRGGLGRLQLDVTAFQMGMQNAIIGRVSAVGVTEYENAGSTDQRGLEASVFVDLTPGGQEFLTQLRPWITASFNDFTFDEFRIRNDQSGAVTDYSGKLIPGVPVRTVTVAVDAAVRPGLYLNATAQHVGEMQIDNANLQQADGYTLVSVRTGLRRSLTQQLRLELFGGVDNATNEKYSSWLGINGFGGRYFNPSLRRNMFGGVSLHIQRG